MFVSILHADQSFPSLGSSHSLPPSPLYPLNPLLLSCSERSRPPVDINKSGKPSCSKTKQFPCIKSWQGNPV